ncbi:MAG: hypothetical protein SV377_08155 [Halobacteria archaeon]|nr:hypothetical protein [Halobacteria archaeon]
MRGIEFRALLKLDDGSLRDVGTATAVNPDELIDQIEARRDEGRINITDRSEVWIIPVDSFIRRLSVPTKDVSKEDDPDGYEFAYSSEEDRRFGDTYVALSQISDDDYIVDGYVRALEFETACRVAASLKGGRMDAKPVVLVPEDTLNRYTVEPN